MNKYDIKYIFKRVVIFFIIFFIMSLLQACEVKAETHAISNSNSRVRMYPSSQYSTFEYNSWYSLPSGQSLYGLDLKLETGFTSDGYGGTIQDTLYSGSYLFDFIIETNNLTDHLASCNGISGVDFRFTDLTSGNVIIPAKSSAGTCLDSYYTTIGGNRAIHYLFQWQVNDTASYPFSFNEFEFIIYNYTGEGFVRYGGSYFIILGNLIDYDPQIVSNFKVFSQQQKLQQETILNATQNAQNIINATQQSTQNLLNSQSIINQNINNLGQDTSTIINQNNEMKATITDDNVSGASAEVDALINNSSFNDSSGIQSIINAPLNFIRSLTNTCSPISLTIPFIDSNVELPCISNVLNTHVPLIVPILATTINGFIIYRILIDIVYLIKSAKNPDEDRLEVLDL